MAFEGLNPRVVYVRTFSSYVPMPLRIAGEDSLASLHKKEEGLKEAMQEAEATLAEAKVRSCDHWDRAGIQLENQVRCMTVHDLLNLFLLQSLYEEKQKLVRGLTKKRTSSGMCPSNVLFPSHALYISRFLFALLPL